MQIITGPEGYGSLAEVQEAADSQLLTQWIFAGPEPLGCELADHGIGAMIAKAASRFRRGAR